MIKMISGVYGMPVVNEQGITTVKSVGPEYGPFSLAPEKEARLVNRGVAAYVHEPEVEEPAEDIHYEDHEVEEPTEPIGFDEVPVEDEEEPIPLEELSAKELRELGAEYGLTFKGNASKAAMIEAITAAQEQDTVEDDGEPAPAFDPAEAVL